MHCKADRGRVVWVYLDIGFWYLLVKFFRSPCHRAGVPVEHQPARRQGQRIFFVRQFGGSFVFDGVEMAQATREPTPVQDRACRDGRV